MLSSATGRGAPFHTDTNDVSAVLANATRRRPDTYEVRCNAELVYGRTAAPPAQRDDGPDRFDDAERPRALQEPIEGSQRARDRESEDEPRTAILERVAHEHGGYGKEAEGREAIHAQCSFAIDSCVLPSRLFSGTALAPPRSFAVRLR